MSDQLEVDDPVSVEREGGKQLEGIVAFLGPVSFAAGDDWVGVRLTGSSSKAGLGRNDGSVKGKRYFNAGPNDGVFVKKTNVQKRTLTKLEQIQLKREIAKFKPVTDPGKSSVRTPRSSTTPRTSTSASRTATSSGKMSRLEEIKARREAALRSRGSAPASTSAAPPGSSKPSSAAPATTTEASPPIQTEAKEDKHVALYKEALTELEEVKKQFEATSTKLKARDEETASLQQTLSRAEQDAHDAKARVEQLEGQLKAVAAAEEEASTMESDAPKEESISEDHHRLQQEHRDLRDAWEKTQEESRALRQELDREREGRTADSQKLTSVRAELAALQHEMQAMSEQQSVRTSSDASHYKERAKLQAEITSWKGKLEKMEEEKLDLETTVEELTLDKEQLQEEKEGLEDRMEELKIDSETAQMEVEELKLELEDAKASTERMAAGVDSAGSLMPDDDAVQLLNIQNARLREALIRLREQTALEKVEITKNLRDAEKDAAKGRDLSNQVDKLQAQKSSLEGQVIDLKEMVEQGSAFEAMIEDLSDRVLELEDVNVTLQATIRELEDGQDLAAELEEVQAEELKALMRDVEGRDSVIRNLEEAIKMQRRREEDFQRTVANYRNSVETLKHEKAELMRLQQGGEGEKNDLLATSQKALARAAQLVADAASARKRAAETAFVEVEAIGLQHLATRLESVMPTSAVAGESAAIKGEMLLCEIVSKAAKTLDGIGEIFTKTVRGANSELLHVRPTKLSGTENFSIPDTSAHAVETMLHQSRFAQSTVDASSKLVRILAFGQWPDVISPDKSAELGTVLVHSLGNLNATTTLTLKLLKEEGVLSPHQSNLGAFKQSASSVLDEIEGALSLEGTRLVDSQWQPPGWELLKNASSAKFYCLGASAAVAAVVAPTGLTQATSGSEQISEETLAGFKTAVAKLDQVVAQALNVSASLGFLDVTDERVSKDLEPLIKDWKAQSSNLFKKVQELFEPKTKCTASRIEACWAQADATQRSVGLVGSVLRAADIKVAEERPEGHPLSAEVGDPWRGISALSRRVRSVDGDADEVNFVQRTHAVETRLSTAIENEPRLAAATTKIASLEKNLTSRSKEIAMQNARLSELERVLAKNNTQASLRPKPVDVSSAEEVNSLKQEIRVLTEAMEVLQSQTDEYEAEIRALKDPKSPMGRKTAGTPRKGGSVFDYTSTPRGRKEDPFAGASLSSIAALEAALFRPALEHARANASRWRAQSVAKAMVELPPLNVVGCDGDESKSQDPDEDPLSGLTAATKGLWMARANISVVDLSNASTPPREQLHVSLLGPLAAENRLRNATASAKQWISNQKGFSSLGTGVPNQQDRRLGKITFPCETMSSTVSINVSADDLFSLQRGLLK